MAEKALEVFQSKMESWDTIKDELSYANVAIVLERRALLKELLTKEDEELEKEFQKLEGTVRIWSRGCECKPPPLKRNYMESHIKFG